jgi:hypothetical protein
MAATSRRIDAAPLDRAILDSAASPTRVFFGLVFLAWSWVSTVVILGQFLVPVLPRAHVGVSDSYLAALILALLVTGVEFVSAGRWEGVYWPVLLCLDASFTTAQTHAWLAMITQPYAELTSGTDILLWIVALVCGIIAAIFGEILLFGRRR